MKGRVFVDTNILIYAHDLDAGAKHEKAAASLEELWEEETGVLSTLLRKPKRRSQTTDMPLNIVVKRAVKAFIPTAMKEM